MSCLPCFRGKRKDDSSSEDEKEVIHVGMTVSIHKKPDNGVQSKPVVKPTGNIQSQTFTFRELAAATNNFSPDCLLGEGGFGRVYQGHLQSGSQVVAIKKLDRNSLQGNREFLVEVLMLSLLHHPNLVNLVGYCADGDQRLLVYEFMPKGCLEDHLLDLESSKQPLNWYARMRIAYGAAQGLEYLHDRANPPVIYRDFKPSNILLDEDLHPKLSDFGLAKLGPYGDKPIASSRVMGTYGYCAPEFARTGQISQKSDVYSFGVVLLELITGRRVIDTTKPTNEENLLTWAQPMFKEQKRYPELVDPLIRGDFPVKGLNQAVAIAAMCIQEEASVRPLMADVVLTLSFLIDGPTFRPISACPEPSPYATPSEFPTTAHSAKSSSDSDFLVDDNTSHVVETLQLGLKSRKSRRSQESISCSNSRNSSPRSGSEGSSRSRSDGGSSSSKHSEVSPKHGSDEGSNSGKSDYESD